MSGLKFCSAWFVCLSVLSGSGNSVLAQMPPAMSVKDSNGAAPLPQKAANNNKPAVNTANDRKNTVNSSSTTSAGNTTVGNNINGESESKSGKTQKGVTKKAVNEAKTENQKKSSLGKAKASSSGSLKKSGSGTKAANLEENKDDFLYETPSAWSIENSKKDEEDSPENFAAMQKTDNNNAYNDAKWLLYVGIGLAAFSILGLAFFILFLIKRRRKSRRMQNSSYDGEWE